MQCTVVDGGTHKRQKTSVYTDVPMSASRSTGLQGIACSVIDTGDLSNSCSSLELDNTTVPIARPSLTDAGSVSRTVPVRTDTYTESMPVVLTRHAVSRRGIASIVALQGANAEFHTVVRTVLIETLGHYTPVDRDEWVARSAKLSVGLGDRELFSEGRAVLLSVAGGDRVVGVMIGEDGGIRLVHRRVIRIPGVHAIGCLRRTKDVPGDRLQLIVVSGQSPSMLVGRTCRIVSPGTTQKDGTAVVRVNALLFEIVSCSQHPDSRVVIETRRVDSISVKSDMLASAVVRSDLGAVLVSIVRRSVS